jgi:chromosome segregation ATPase
MESCYGVQVRHSEAASELKTTKEELAEVRMVAEGALARREVLEGQIKRAREQVKQLLAKSDDDDSLIRTLHARLTAQTDRCAGAHACAMSGALVHVDRVLGVPSGNLTT